MKRRTFSGLLGASLVAGNLPLAFAKAETEAKPFKAKFGPHPNQLPTGPKPYLEQLQFAHDLGFRAWEDNGLGNKNPEIQEKVGAFCKDNGIALGVMVISGGAGMSFFKADKDGTKRVLADMKRGVEAAKRTGQTCMTMIPGIRVQGTPLDQQITGAADLMKRCCDIVEEHGIILVQEPLSHGVKGGEPLLRSFEDGFKLCQAVQRKSCKILADFYHEGEIGNGDQLIANARAVWSQVGYVQYGDVPGRKEPGTGKLDLGAVTRWLREQNYQGVIGMEHGTSAKGPDGLAKLLASYRSIDA